MWKIFNWNEKWKFIKKKKWIDRPLQSRIWRVYCVQTTIIIMTFDMEDTFRAFKHAAQMKKKKFHFWTWERVEDKKHTQTDQKQNLSHKTEQKKERKSLCAMKIYYNSINSIGIQCKIWLPINEPNSIVQEKWIMRYPIFFLLLSFIVWLFLSCIKTKEEKNK